MKCEGCREVEVIVSHFSPLILLLLLLPPFPLLHRLHCFHNHHLIMGRYCISYVGCVVLTEVDMSVVIIGAIALSSPCVNRRFGGTHHLHLQGTL
jgi:hypothetical protein